MTSLLTLLLHGIVQFTGGGGSYRKLTEDGELAD